MENKTQIQKTTPEPGIKGLMANEMVKSKFTEILGKGGNSFISSVTTLATTTKLIECEPKSVLSAAIAAACLNLPVTPTLGFAAIIPYGKQAQFQIMSKGLIQLALRSGQFKTINVTEIFEGELKQEDRLTGLFDFTGEKKSDKVIGYAAYFELLNGFNKSLYMTVDQIRAHGKKFSKTYTFAGSAWQSNFEGMAKKTVLKLLLSRYAPLSVEMQQAVTFDQATLKTDEHFDFVEVESYTDNEEEKENPETKRITLMIQDCTTLDQLNKLADQIPEELKPTFLAKYNELSNQPAKERGKK